MSPVIQASVVTVCVSVSLLCVHLFLFGGKVQTYVHPATGCHYFYTLGTPLVPAETGDGGDQYGCMRGRML